MPLNPKPQKAPEGPEAGPSAEPYALRLAQSESCCVLAEHFLKVLRETDGVLLVFGGYSWAFDPATGLWFRV